MLKVVCINTNGIRSAIRKGFYPWLANINPDVVCIQETKAWRSQLEEQDGLLPGYHCYFHDAQKKGYSGTAIFCKQKPLKVHYGLGFEVADNEGRCVQVDFERLSIVSIYLPSGTTGEARQAVKYDFLDRFEEILCKAKQQDRDYIFCGDFNIAHKKIDIKNWRGNQKNSGFLPEERAWMDKLFDQMGFVDTFREINQEEDQYTWWSNRGQAWAKNVGWRLDYQVINSEIKNTVKNVEIYKKERFSDHAPFIVTYQLTL